MFKTTFVLLGLFGILGCEGSIGRGDEEVQPAAPGPGGQEPKPAPNGETPTAPGATGEAWSSRDRSTNDLWRHA